MLPRSDSRKSAVEDQFNNVAHEYLSKYSTPEILRSRERILSLLERPCRYHTILDIGCGPGTLSFDLLKVGDHIWGIDISKAMVANATDTLKGSHLHNRVHFKTGDAENLPFPDQHFDAVVCLGVLRYLPSWKRGLQEIHRVLKPDGVAVVTFFYRFSPHWFSMCFLYRPLLPLISFIRGKTIVEMIRSYRAEPLPLSYRQFKREFLRAGFRDVQTQHAGFDVFPLNRLFPLLSRYCYLKAEAAFFDSSLFGWLGSICVVKGSKHTG